MRGVIFLGGVGLRSLEIFMDFDMFPPSRKYIQDLSHETVGGDKVRGVIFFWGGRPQIS